MRLSKLVSFSFLFLAVKRCNAVPSVVLLSSSVFYKCVSEELAVANLKEDEHISEAKLIAATLGTVL